MVLRKEGVRTYEPSEIVQGARKRSGRVVVISGLVAVGEAMCSWNRVGAVMAYRD
jgi:hypothetical protein